VTRKRRETKPAGEGFSGAPRFSGPDHGAPSLVAMDSPDDPQGDARVGQPERSQAGKPGRRDGR